MLLCYTLQAAWHDMRTLAAVTDSRLLDYTAGTLKNEKKQAKTLRGRKDTLALVYFYWGGGDRPLAPSGSTPLARRFMNTFITSKIVVC